MKNETKMDILMVVAIVLAIAGALVFWGLYDLGASVAVMCLEGVLAIIGVGACCGKMYELAESEEVESDKEERL